MSGECLKGVWKRPGRNLEGVFKTNKHDTRAGVAEHVLEDGHVREDFILSYSISSNS